MCKARYKLYKFLQEHLVPSNCTIQLRQLEKHPLSKMSIIVVHQLSGDADVGRVLREQTYSKKGNLYRFSLQNASQDF